MLNTDAHPEAPSILIVDDETIVQWSLTKVLNAEGFAARAVATAEEAIVTVRQDRPDVMISDVSLLGKNGDTLAEQVHSEYPEVRILLMSGHAHLEDELVYPFISKPFSPADLVAKVRGLLAA